MLNKILCTALDYRILLFDSTVEVACKIIACQFNPVISRRRHDGRKNVNEQHSESDRQQKKRFIFLLDCKIHQDACNHDHDVVERIIAFKAG